MTTNVTVDNTNYSVTVDNTNYAITLSVNGSIIGNLNELSDVTIASPANGEVLQYNGSVWVNNLAAGTGDMAKSVYDTNDDGIVDNAAALGGSTLSEVLAAGGSVTSVNSQTGVVVLDADDISDSTTTNKFVTSTQISTWDGKQDSLTVGVDYLVASSIAASYEPLKGSDDNYVTDAQLTVIGNTSGTNTGDQTITLTGDVTGSGTGTFATIIAEDAVDIAMLSASGTAGSTTFLRGDNVWSVPAGSGDVSKVGTPVDNQVGVWTGDGTIEGTTGLTYDGSALDITGNITLSGTVDNINIANLASSVTTNNAKVSFDWDYDYTDLINSPDIPSSGVDFDPVGTDNSTDVTLAGQDFLSITGQQITANKINIDNLSASGTASSTTYLRGDNTWSTVSGGGDVVDDTTPQLGGNLDYNGKGIKLASQTVSGSDGNVVYLSGSLTWSQADASAESTAGGLVGIRLSASEVLLEGIYTTTGLTAGAKYYISETAGALTTTAPTTSEAIVRVIGYALSTTRLLVKPHESYVEND
jgi:hypothetical protein